MKLSGYFSVILGMRRVPMPEPVLPLREWVGWKPWRESQLSASFLTASSSVPSI